MYKFTINFIIIPDVLQEINADIFEFNLILTVMCRLTYKCIFSQEITLKYFWKFEHKNIHFLSHDNNS